jgi:hypothetical protein
MRVNASGFGWPATRRLSSVARSAKEDHSPFNSPTDLDTYVDYRRRSIEFIEARNRRIERDAAASQ